MVSRNVVSSSVAARPPSQATPIPAKRIREPGKFHHAVHLECHME